MSSRNHLLRREVKDKADSLKRKKTMKHKRIDKTGYRSQPSLRKSWGGVDSKRPRKSGPPLCRRKKSRTRDHCRVGPGRMYKRSLGVGMVFLKDPG